MTTTLTANDLLTSIASDLHGGDMSIARRAIINSLGNPIIESADMYKTSHKDMYPENMTKLQSYCEPRTGASLDKIVVFGIQLLVNDLASIRVTQKATSMKRTDSLLPRSKIQLCLRVFDLVGRPSSTQAVIFQ